MVTGGSSVTHAGWGTLLGPLMPEELESWVARHISSSPAHGQGCNHGVAEITNVKAIRDVRTPFEYINASLVTQPLTYSAFRNLMLAT